MYLPNLKQVLLLLHSIFGSLRDVILSLFPPRVSGRNFSFCVPPSSRRVQKLLRSREREEEEECLSTLSSGAVGEEGKGKEEGKSQVAGGGAAAEVVICGAIPHEEENLKSF